MIQTVMVGWPPAHHKEAPIMMTLYALNREVSQEYRTASPKKRFVTEEEYWDKYYDAPDIVYEWKNGYLEEKPVSNHATYLMYLWFLKLLEHHTQARAKLTGLEMGFRLELPNETDIRRPDLGVVLNDNPVPLLPHHCAYFGIFDICVEAVSDSSAKVRNNDMVIKKAEYAASGVKEYYLLEGKGNPLEFFQINQQGIYVPIERIDGDIIQSSVLIGFQFRISDLDYRPSVEEMINDPVYQGFVLPGYSDAKKIAEASELRLRRLKPRLKGKNGRKRRRKPRLNRSNNAPSDWPNNCERWASILMKSKCLLGHSSIIVQRMTWINGLINDAWYN
jgi:hypothetical protein